MSEVSASNVPVCRLTIRKSGEHGKRVRERDPPSTGPGVQRLAVESRFIANRLFEPWRIAMTAIPSSGIEPGQWWKQWKKLVTAGLDHQNPLAVLRLLKLANVPNGIFQVELHTATDIRQCQLAKLTHKLRDAGWISISTPHPATRGRCLVRTTARGRDVLAAFNSIVRAPAKTRSTRPSHRLRHPQTQRGQPCFEFQAGKTGEAGIPLPCPGAPLEVKISEGRSMPQGPPRQV